MNDKIYINDLKQSYEIINNTNSEIDNKALNMIILTSAMVTLQLSFILPTFKDNPAGASICFWSSISYLLSILLFIIVLCTKRFKYYPDMSSIIDNYENMVDEEDYVTLTIGRYGSTNKYNLKVVNFKGIVSRISFIFFIMGLVLTIISVVI